MYTEIVKIIEGGIANDMEKVVNYALVLAENLEKQGELRLARKIKSTIEQKKGSVGRGQKCIRTIDKIPL